MASIVKKDVSFKNKSGTGIEATLFCRPETDGRMGAIFGHGASGTKDSGNVPRFAESLAGAGIPCITCRGWLQDQLRDKPLMELKMPLLFLRGTNDPFSTPEPWAAVMQQMSSINLQVRLSPRAKGSHSSPAALDACCQALAEFARSAAAAGPDSAAGEGGGGTPEASEGQAAADPGGEAGPDVAAAAPDAAPAGPAGAEGGGASKGGKRGRAGAPSAAKALPAKPKGTSDKPAARAKRAKKA